MQPMMSKTQSVQNSGLQHADPVARILAPTDRSGPSIVLGLRDKLWRINPTVEIVLPVPPPPGALAVHVLNHRCSPLLHEVVLCILQPNFADGIAVVPVILMPRSPAAASRQTKSNFPGHNAGNRVLP